MNKKGQVETIFAVVSVVIVLFGAWLIYSGLTTGNGDRLFIGIIGVGLGLGMAKLFAG